MIGYLIQQELGNELPFEKRLASLLTLIEVDGADPAFARPTKPIGPVYTEGDAATLGAEKGWLFEPDGDDFRRVVPSPLPRRIFGLEPVEWLLEHGCVVICAGGGGIPVMYADEPAVAGRRLVGVEAVIDKDLASALLATELEADALAIVTDVDAVYADWGTPRQRAIRPAPARRPWPRPSSRPDRWGRRCAQRAPSSSRPAAWRRSAPSRTRRHCCGARRARSSPAKQPGSSSPRWHRRRAAQGGQTAREGRAGAGHSITRLAMAGGSRPARSQPAAAAANGTPTTARAR